MEGFFLKFMEFVDGLSTINGICMVVIGMRGFDWIKKVMMNDGLKSVL